MSDDISELFLAIAQWMKSAGAKDVSKQPQPWHGELKTADDTLRVAFNASKEPVTDDGLEIPPWTAAIRSDTYLAVGLIHPYGGILGGFSEDRLIDAFRSECFT